MGTKKMATSNIQNEDPNANVELRQDQSTMPIKSYPIFPMAMLGVVSALILLAALIVAQSSFHFFKGESARTNLQNKSNEGSTPVQSDALKTKLWEPK